MAEIFSSLANFTEFQRNWMPLLFKLLTIVSNKSVKQIDNKSY